MSQISLRNILFHQSSGFLVAIEEDSGIPMRAATRLKESNRRGISDGKEKRIALVKREARKVPVQWDEK